MALSLDQEIGRKADAMRRMDPRVAQNQAKQSDDFLSLIALQKLKSEKDAAQRELALQMEQRPETIIKQREEELLKRNKDDLLKQTAGIMNIAQQREQQNLQRAAQGSQSPMQAGMGNLARQVRPEIARMAGGGIIGYQKGTLVKDEDEEEIVDEFSDVEVQGPMEEVEDLSGYGYSPEVREKMGSKRRFDRDRRPRAPRFQSPTREKLRGLAGQYGYGADASSEMARRAGGARDIAPIAPIAASAIANVDERGFPKDVARAAPPPPKVDDRKIVPGTTPGTTPGIAGANAGLPSISIPQIRAQAPDYSGVGTVGRGILDATGLGGSMESRRDDSYKYLMGDDAARYQKLMDRLDALNKKQSDPEALGIRQFGAWASGIGRKGLGAGTPALMAEQDRQAKAERDRFAEMMGLEKELMTAQRGARSTAIAAAMDDRRTAATIMANTTVDERKAARDFVKNQLEADKANQTAKLGELKVEAQNALNKSIKEQENQTKIAARLDSLANKKQEYIKSFLDADQGLLQLRSAEAKAIKDNDPEKAQQIRANIKKRTDLITFGALQTLNDIGFLSLEEQLMKASGLEPQVYEGINRSKKADKYIQAAGG
jgi:predicted GIY-YIG superfamily endonuclease